MILGIGKQRLIETLQFIGILSLQNVSNYLLCFPFFYRVRDRITNSSQGLGGKSEYASPIPTWAARVSLPSPDEKTTDF